MFKVDSEKLIRLRKAKSKTQAHMAGQLKIDQSAYSRKEKTGEFTEAELNTVYKFLGIKKEQIELNESTPEVGSLSYLVSKSIQTESALTVILGALAEILAHQSGGNVTKIRTDLESAVNSLSRSALEKLEHPV